MNLNEIYEQAEREDKLVAVVKYPYQKPEVIAIDKGLAPIQKTVGGNIDVVYLPDIDDVHGFCNDEGLFIGMEPNFYRPEYKDAIVGPAIFFGSGCDGGSDYPVSDLLADNGFYLPSGSNLREADIDRVCDVIAAFAR